VDELVSVLDLRRCVPTGPSAAVLIEAIFGGTFEPWDTEVVSDDPLRFSDTKPYRERLEAATQRSAQSESVVAGRARLGVHDVVVIAGEFDFMAGTMGVASARRVVRAFDRAVELGLPVIGLPVSGGTRMQEGTVAFIQMAAVAAAVQRHHAAGLPYLVHLRNPTTGGVLASWGSLGHVRTAAPGALIGLTGPRVIRELTGEDFPGGVQVAENLWAHGIVDDVVLFEEVAHRFERVLDVACLPADPWDLDVPPLGLPADATVDGWKAVERSRRTDRPGIRELLAVCARDVTTLRGDGAGVDDPGCFAALARVCGVGVVVVGHDRPPGLRGARLGAAGYRKARQAMELADELGLPLLTVIDTEGARISIEDEQGGLAAEIARCLATLTSVRVPTLSLLLGEGAGGGAIAFLPADRVVAAEHAWLAPIQPEGASAILHRTTANAPELASAQATSSTDLRRLGVVDIVIPDRPSASDEGQRFGDRVAATASRELHRLVFADDAERLPARADRYHPDRGSGSPG
jgi:acyl-CoA carboxylase subunit beta